MTTTNNVRVMNELEILNAALAVGWVKFSYYKADGTKRIAIGTRNLAIIEQILGKRTEQRKASNYFTNCNGYFDLIRVDWRQFNTNRFIGIELNRMSDEQAVRESVIISLTESGSESTIDSIEMISVRLNGVSNGHRIVTDSKREWCMKYNGGRGLNGVLLSAAGNGGSGCLGWPSVGGHLETKLEVKQVANNSCKNRREELIAELQKIRKREEEILAELLYQY